MLYKFVRVGATNLVFPIPDLKQALGIAYVGILLPHSGVFVAGVRWGLLSIIECKTRSYFVILEVELQEYLQLLEHLQIHRLELPEVMILQADRQMPSFVSQLDRVNKTEGQVHLLQFAAEESQAIVGNQHKPQFGFVLPDELDLHDHDEYLPVDSDELEPILLDLDVQSAHHILVFLLVFIHELHFLDNLVGILHDDSFAIFVLLVGVLVDHIEEEVAHVLVGDVVEYLGRAHTGCALGGELGIHG